MCRRKYSTSVSPRLTLVLSMYLLVGLTAAGIDHGSTQGGSTGTAVGSSLLGKSANLPIDALQNDDEKLAAAALMKLTKDPQTLEDNLSLLLNEAKRATGTMDFRLLRDRGGEVPKFIDSEAKGAMILRRLAESIRETPDDVQRERLLRKFLPVVQEAVSGRYSSIPRPGALQTYYFCIYFSSLSISPRATPAREDMITTLQKRLDDDDPNMRREARDLLVEVAQFSPDRRQSILKQLKDLHVLEGIALIVERKMSGEYEGIPEDTFRAVQKMNDENLFKYVISTLDSNSYSFLDFHVYVLVRRPLDPQKRLQLMQRVLHNRSYSSRFAACVVPFPIGEAASDADKEYTDAVIKAIDAELDKIDISSSVVNWGIRSLCQIVLGDVGWFDSEKHARAIGPEASPYALDRVLQTLFNQLASKNTIIQGQAARSLGGIAWLSPSTAQQVMDRLLIARESFKDKSYPQGPDPKGDVEWAIAQSKEALSVLSVPKAQSAEKNTPQPTPTVPE